MQKNIQQFEACLGQASGIPAKKRPFYVHWVKHFLGSSGRKGNAGVVFDDVEAYLHDLFFSDG